MGEGRGGIAVLVWGGGVGVEYDVGHGGGFESSLCGGSCTRVGVLGKSVFFFFWLCGLEMFGIAVGLLPGVGWGGGWCRNERINERNRVCVPPLLA